MQWESSFWYVDVSSGIGTSRQNFTRPHFGAFAVRMAAFTRCASQHIMFYALFNYIHTTGPILYPNLSFSVITLSISIFICNPEARTITPFVKHLCAFIYCTSAYCLFMCMSDIIDNNLITARFFWEGFSENLRQGQTITVIISSCIILKTRSSGQSSHSSWIGHHTKAGPTHGNKVRRRSFYSSFI